MIHRLALTACSVATVLMAACLAAADPPGTTGDEKDKPARELAQPGTGKGYRNPLEPSPRMRDALGTVKPPTGQPAKPPPAPGGITLRARVLRKGQPPTALIEVDGRLYAITTGSVIATTGNTMLKVLQMNSLEIQLELSSTKEKIVLR